MVEKKTRLFIPLKTEYYNQFKDGSKTIEYRPYGPRWNESTCYPGRPVTISRGYGTRDRIDGYCEGLTLNYNPDSIPGWSNCYGGKNIPIAACIHIKLNAKMCSIAGCGKEATHMTGLYCPVHKLFHP